MTRSGDSITFVSEDEPNDALVSLYYESEDIEEEETRQTFQKAPMHTFIVFISSGLPDNFLKTHKRELWEDQSTLDKIKKAIEGQIHDPVLRNYLESRLEVIRNFRQDQEEREMKNAEFKLDGTH